MIFSLVPLTVYQVTYELAHGRPYSKLEELVLKSVGAQTAERGLTFAELRQVFQVHDRLLTEALVTLIQEGWVTMEQSGTEIRFLATQEGRLTIDKGRRPSNRRTRTATVTIVRERLTGQLARFTDVSPVKATSLRGDGTRKAKRQALTAKVMRTEINGGETERLLPRSRQNQEWVRWINSVSQVSQDLHYLPVRVDLDAAAVAGLPSAWQHLAAPILEEVAERSAQLTDDAAFQNEIRGFMRSRAGQGDTVPRQAIRPFAAVPASCADTAITAVETASLIEGALTKGVSRVFLAVSNLDERRAAASADLLTRLASEGVKVDVLWSLADPSAPSRAIFNHLTRARAGAPRETLIFNSEPSKIAADLLLAETTDGPVGVIGCSVTEPGLGDNALSIAVKVTDNFVLAALARLGSGYWDTVDGDQAKLVGHRWKYYAERWAEEGTLAAAPELVAADPECPYHPGGRCSGEIAILTGTQAEAARSALLRQQRGRRLLLSDGGTATATLITEFTTDTTDLPTCLYQAFGGSDGWYFMRRGDPGKWVDYPRPNFTPPSPSQRVTGTAAQWLISPIGGPQESSLSIRLTGHIATTAWERTSRAHLTL